MTEVSELSNEGALTLAQADSGSSVTIPSIKTRRAETTVEIPSGGSLAMAGMIQEQTKQQINGLPGLMQLPVLGTLFKSRDYLNRQTELMVLVTPYVVRAVAQKELSRAGRRLRRRDRSGIGPARPAQPHLRNDRQDRARPRLPRQLRFHSRLSGRDEDMQMTSSATPTPRPRRRDVSPWRAMLLAGVAVALAGCQHQPR